jgi:hypothetical protein
MAMDFNSAPEQRTMDLVPDGTVVTVQMTVRPGSSGDGGWLKRSKNGDSEALDAEFTIVDGQYAKRKFWTLFTVQGTTEGHSKAAEISGAKIRAILESARGVRPDDTSPEAAAKRRIATWGELDGLRFMTKVGVEKGRDGYKDKNIIGDVVTPDRKGWAKVEQAPAAVTAPAAVAAAAPTNKPAWAS